MITYEADKKYGWKYGLAGFLVAHLPKKDGTVTVDYDIVDVDALNNGGCDNGNGKGAVGKVYKD